MKHLAWLLMLVAAACSGGGDKQSRETPAPDAPADSQPVKPAKSVVVRIELPEMESPLPEAPGRDTVDILCGSCHSHRYITMQPRFSRKAWEATVDKMKKTFGAPVPDEKLKEVVDYLVAVRGTEIVKSAN